MNVPDDVLRGIGGIAVNAVWLELVAASFHAHGEEEAVAIVRDSGAALKRGRQAAAAVADPELQARAQKWLDRATELLESSRHPYVHGLAYYNREGQWLSRHPKTDIVRPLDPDEIHRKRVELDHHAGIGWGIAWEIWNQRPADPVRTEESS